MMNSNHLRGMTKLIVAVTLLLSVSLPGQAQYSITSQVLQIDFDSATLGQDAPTSVGGPYPHTNVTAIVGDFSDPGTGEQFSQKIGNIAGLNHALIMSNTYNYATFQNWVDNLFDPQGGTGKRPVLSRFEFDFAPISEPATGSDNTGFRRDWQVIAFKQVGGSPNAQAVWALTMSHLTNGVINLDYGFPVSIAVGHYTNGLVTHVLLDTYMEGSGYFDLYLNGGLAAYHMPFRNSMANPDDHISEIFFDQFSATNTFGNVVAIDNLSYTIFIPEPSPILLAAIGLVTVGVIFRRVRRKA